MHPEIAEVIAGTRPWTVITGDCLDVLKTMPSGCVDCILCDPPYGHNNNNGDLIHRREAALGHGEAGKARPIANDGAEANEVFRGVLPEFARLLMPGCCCGGGGGPDPQFARWSLWLDEVLDFKQMVVWDKGPIGMGWHYRRSYETVLVAEKRGAACRWFDKTDRIENIIRPGDYGVRKIIPSATDHPTPKPIELAVYFLRLHTRPGDMVLDPFCGCGWVGSACALLGRRFIGIEIDEKYAAIARRRIADAAPLFVPVPVEKQMELGT
jgi:DNA modification methylase